MGEKFEKNYIETSTRERPGFSAVPLAISASF